MLHFGPLVSCSTQAASEQEMERNYASVHYYGRKLRSLDVESRQQNISPLPAAIIALSVYMRGCLWYK